MSQYGAPPPPPQDPNQPNPYGGQPNPYGGQPGYGAQAPANYAGWGSRVGAVLIDGLIGLLFYIPALVGIVILVASADTSTSPNGTQSAEVSGAPAAAGFILILLGGLLYLGYIIWNLFIKQGRTGYTIGKGIVGIKLISESTGQPIGAGSAFLRQLAHFLDSICYIGYLWPLWDQKNQTFADKIMTTVVISQPKP